MKRHAEDDADWYINSCKWPKEERSSIPSVAFGTPEPPKPQKEVGVAATAEIPPAYGCACEIPVEAIPLLRRPKAIGTEGLAAVYAPISVDTFDKAMGAFWTELTSVKDRPATRNESGQYLLATLYETDDISLCRYICVAELLGTPAVCKFTYDSRHKELLLPPSVDAVRVINGINSWIKDRNSSLRSLHLCSTAD